MGFGGMVGRNDDRENEMQHLGRITKSVFRRAKNSPSSTSVKKKKPNHSKLVKLHQEVHNSKIIPNKISSIKSIKSLHKELTSAKSNKAKCNLLSPIFQNLHEGNLIYYDKITMLIEAEINLSEDGLSGKATKKVLISGEDKTTMYDQLPLTWTFQAPWKGIWFTKESIYSVYEGWTLWPDPKLVKYVKKLIISNRKDEALKVTSRSLNLK